MRNFFWSLVVMIMFVCQSACAEPSPQWVKNLPAAQVSEQIKNALRHEHVKPDCICIIDSPENLGGEL